MEDQNIIIFLDKIKKLIELGNTPKAVIDMDALIIKLEHKLRKQNGKVINPLSIPLVDEISKTKQFSADNRKKINEIIRFINMRYSV